MISIAILLLILGFVVGAHVHICAVSGRASTSKIFAEFMLFMILIGAGSFLGILSKNLITLKEAKIFFLIYLLLALIAATSMVFSSRIMLRVEWEIFKDLSYNRKCKGCIDCFIYKIQKLIEGTLEKNNILL